MRITPSFFGSSPPCLPVVGGSFRSEEVGALFGSREKSLEPSSASRGTLRCMARALRTDFAGALHHVTSRGNERRSIFYDDNDHEVFLKYLGNAASFSGSYSPSFA